VLRREVTLKKADLTEVLELQRPDAAYVPVGVPSLPVPPTQAVGAANTSYAPYTPRSTPKNGEADGL
jgi:general secretion pathway protein N